MHDFFLAKEIIGKVMEVAQEKKLKKISAVRLEIGSIAFSHDGMPDHAEEINMENLQFGLESLAKNTVLEGARFEIKRAGGDVWRIESIEAE